MEITSVWAAFLFSFLVVGLTTWTYRWRNPRCKGRLPPGSMGLPLIGETFRFFVTSNSIDIHPFIKERLQRYGPLFKTSIAGRSMVISSAPDFNFSVLQQEDKLVELNYMDTVNKIFNFDTTGMTQGGFVHKYLRGVVLSCIGSEALKEKQMSLLEHAVNNGFHEWIKHPQVELKEQIASMLGDITAKILFSYESNKSKESLGENLCNGMRALLKFPLYIPGTAFYQSMKKQQKVVKMLSELLEERMKCSEGCKGDLLDQMEMGKQEFRTIEFLTFFMFALLLASVDTLSTTIAIATKYLLENPSELQQVIEEHEEIKKSREEGSHHEGLSWKEYKSMTYTHYVIKETLRLSSVSPGIPRRVKTDIHVDGYTIPKDWILMIIPTSLHLNPNIYEDPLTFRPSRWKLIKDMGGISSAKSFIPFGGGNRSCAGAEYSKLLIAIFIHVWVTKYRCTKINEGDLVRTPMLEFKNGFYVKFSKKYP